MDKPYSKACENNRIPILEALSSVLPADASVLEVGSGTGQHAVYFAAQQPGWRWQTADQPSYHSGIQAWLDEAGLENIQPPLSLDVRDFGWSAVQYDAVYTANTLHIMSLQSAQDFLLNVSKALKPGGVFVAYGPFNYEGKYTSDSNARFDQWLLQQHPDSAIRDIETLDRCAQQGGLSLQHDLSMPANNRVLVWKFADFEGV